MRLRSVVRKILTQRLEDLGCSKFPVKEDGAVVGVEEATHPDQNHLHRAWRQRTEDTGMVTRQEEKPGRHPGQLRDA